MQWEHIVWWMFWLLIEYLAVLNIYSKSGLDGTTCHSNSLYKYHILNIFALLLGLWDQGDATLFQCREGCQACFLLQFQINHWFGCTWLHLVISYLATEFIWAIDLVTSSHLQPSPAIQPVLWEFQTKLTTSSWKWGSDHLVTGDKTGDIRIFNLPRTVIFERNQVSTRSTLHIAAIVLYRSI